ncbi:MAG: hypothetical protein HYX24_02635 [Candidatus Aenigmarchaeota archaeon]|nr:hypothetical protein [Candidatus Aenigmarchaeota archaeon]
MVVETLRKIGLTESEIKVYLTLLDLGSSATGQIIRKSGLHSSRTYECLEKLQLKGLVSFVVKANKKYFEAASPERIMDFMNERQEEIEIVKKEVKDIIPELNARKKFGKPVQEATIYSGYKGMKSILENMLEELKSGGEYYVFGADGGMRDVLGFYFKVYQKKKYKYNIRSKVIFGERARNTQLLKEYIGEAKFVAAEYSSPTDTFIYGDNIVLFIWNEKPPFAVLIRNRSTAESYKNYFHLLWKAANS